MMKYIYVSIISLLAFFATTCDTPDTGPLAGTNYKITVTLTVLETGEDYSTLRIKIDNPGQQYINDVGLVYDIFGEPTVEYSFNYSIGASSAGTQTLDQTITGLSSGSTYYIRPYFNVGGQFAYGEEQVCYTSAGAGGIPTGTLVYSDDFSSSYNSIYEEVDYTIDNGFPHTRVIEDGYLKLKHYSDGTTGGWTAETVPGFNPSNDFRIKVEFMFRPDTTTSWVSEFGLMWGNNSTDDYKVIYMVDKEQDYWIGYNQYGSWTSWVNYYYTSSINTNGRNILEIIKYNSTLYFYLNNIELYSRPAVYHYSSEVGFWYFYGEYWVDRLSVYAIN